MKKITLILMASIGLWHFHAVYADIITSSYQNDQDTVKANVGNQAGLTFKDFEESLRKKYHDLPIIIVADQLSADAAFSPSDKGILINAASYKALPSGSSKWLVLHEAGHAQKPWVSPSIFWSVTALQGLTGYFWGIHKKQPYKNMMTKFGSKVGAMLAISSLVNVSLHRLEESRADNYANKHADAEILQGGISYLQLVKETIGSDNSIIQSLVDPIHPSVNYRIRKIEKTLKDRFNIESE